jgi:uncharacterized repeat protein (TIGR03803 family)
MQRSTIRHHAFAPSAAAALVALLAACAGSQPPIGAPGALAQIRSSTNGYAMLHSFGHGADGRDPKAALINVRGTLYGTTYAGGSSGNGTVFSVSTSGAETVLYNFQGGNDGANPSAALLAVKGALYGTTEYGGEVFDVGTVFKLQKDGSRESLLHTFGSIPDGQLPIASLIDVKGKLYGTTSSGGAYSYDGTVFEISPKGKEKILHSFEFYGDGASPAANLVALKGILYGTTESGGGYSSYGGGTVFSITRTGTEMVVHRFATYYTTHSFRNGGFPVASLIDVMGTLYGTTSLYEVSGGGTAFSITTSGDLTTLHPFGSGSDGSRPDAPLLYVRGKLYGTTSAGGAYGGGTIFRMSLGGKETVLHSFGYGRDGAKPLAGLVEVKGVLYGTTSAGGSHDEGTVFALDMEK